MLAGQVLYHLSHLLALLALVIFEIGSEFKPRPAWTYASHVAGMTDA
jgi:hypothetical protein